MIPNGFATPPKSHTYHHDGSAAPPYAFRPTPA
jgi:hypothetical protein